MKTKTKPSPNVKQSKKKTDWLTPAPIVEIARYAMGGIDTDPCAHPDHRLRIGTHNYYAEGEKDYTDWEGNVFVNPPGGMVKQFWARLWLAIARGECTSIFWVGFSLEQLAYLDPSPLTYGRNAACILRKRIQFIDGGDPHRTPRPSHQNYLFCYGDNDVLHRFQQIVDERQLRNGPFFGGVMKN